MSLIFDDYIGEALRSEQPKDVLIGDEAFVSLAIETLIAAGELADLLKKQLIYGKRVKDQGFVETMDRLIDFAQTSRDTYSGHPDLDTELKLQPRLTHAVLGGYGEQAELLEALINPDKLDLVNVKEEAGDTLWYAALLLDELATLGVAEPIDVANANIAKLRVRFPDKFTLAASEGRDVVAERAVLEVAHVGEETGIAA